MAIFFLLVGLEIKRELIQGHLSTRQQFSLPAVAAIGGITVPAIIYISLNFGNDVTTNGWAIPTATDIAFALGVVNKSRASLNSRLSKESNNHPHPRMLTFVDTCVWSRTRSKA